MGLLFFPPLWSDSEFGIGGCDLGNDMQDKIGWMDDVCLPCDAVDTLS